MSQFGSQKHLPAFDLLPIMKYHIQTTYVAIHTNRKIVTMRRGDVFTNFGSVYVPRFVHVSADGHFFFFSECRPTKKGKLIPNR